MNNQPKPRPGKLRALNAGQGQRIIALECGPPPIDPA
jgi:hypothetical protein